MNWNHRQNFLLWIFYIANISLIQAQTLELKGKVTDLTGQTPLQDVRVVDLFSGEESISGIDGIFQLVIPRKDEVTLQFNYLTEAIERRFKIPDDEYHNLGTITLDFRLERSDEQIFTIILSEDDEANAGSENISGVLTASRDVFLNSAAYVFGPVRFRVRGYDSENALTYLNGLPMNDLEDGRIYWGQWGGLNDITRNQEVQIGANPATWSFGGILGTTMIDLRARNQRPQKRFTYSLTNRSYRHRAMGTWSTGMLEDGWAVSLSVSRRWAEEGYIEGSFYDASGYCLSVDKQLNDENFLNLVFLGAPVKRGRYGAAIKEMYDIAGTNYYNPYWGNQNGEKRNSRVSDTHQPLIMLRHDFEFNTHSVLSTTVGYEFGKYGSSALDWYNANDPRPDYYRRLPSYAESPELAAEVFNTLSENKALRQIQWDEFYKVNMNNMTTIEDVEGIEGNDITGKLSHYIIEDRHYDSDRKFFNTNLQHVLNDRVTLSAGASFIHQTIEIYKLVDDLLGGEFYVDYDKFAERDIIDNPDAKQNDLNNPNRLLGEGDIFGYHYDGNIRDGQIWGQVQYKLPKWEFFGGATASMTRFWRTGHFRNGKFPQNSFGDSDKYDFTNYGVKAGALYKIDGRNYLSLNGFYKTRAPFFRNAFVSPRTRHQIVDGLENETIRSGEFSYLLRSPYLKARLTGYYTEFLDQIVSRSFYHDDQNSFVNLSMTNVDKEHVGVEAAAEVAIFPGLKAHGVASVGQYIYTSRPLATITQDNNAEVLQENIIVYAKNFYVSGTPQSAYTFGLSYRSKDYWSAYLNLNYFDDIWLDFNPIRRTTDAIDLVEPGSFQFNTIINQEQLPSAFTVNLSFYKSWLIEFGEDRYYLSVNLSANNLLDNTDFITGGYEQLRFDYEEKDVSAFPSRYYYFQGLSYYFNIALRF